VSDQTKWERKPSGRPNGLRDELRQTMWSDLDQADEWQDRATDATARDRADGIATANLRGMTVNSVGAMVNATLKHPMDPGNNHAKGHSATAHMHDHTDTFHSESRIASHSYSFGHHVMKWNVIRGTFAAVTLTRFTDLLGYFAWVRSHLCGKANVGYLTVTNE
jgi:hypothetical protein